MIRFYGINKPAIGRAGRRVCYCDDGATPKEYFELADNLVAFDWGCADLEDLASFDWGPGITDRRLPRAGSKGLAAALCLAALPGEFERAKAVYMRFRQRYVDTLPDNWKLTDAQIVDWIVGIEEDGEAARRTLARRAPDRPPMLTDAGGPTTLGSRIVWDTDIDGQQIVPKDPEDFAWQPAPLARR